MIALATTFDRRALLGPQALIDRSVELLQRADVPDGRGALVIDAQLDAGPTPRSDRLDGLIAILEKVKTIPVLAVEAPSGLAGRPALASLDKEESRLAVLDVEATLRRASALGARYVVLRLGWVEGARRDWLYARDRFLRAQLGRPLADQLRAARDRVAPGHVDRARSALDRLCRVADSLGTILLVKNGQRYVELPSAPEWTSLAQDLAGAPIAGLFDRPAAHLPALMGFTAPAIAAAAFAGPVRYAGDACGAIAALPLGHGELGPEPSEPAREDAHVVFRPWPQLDEDEVVLGLRRLVSAPRG